jgi:hypothetical protein
MGPVTSRGVTRQTKNDLSLEVSRTGTLPETPPQTPFIIGGDKSAVMMVTVKGVEEVGER